MAKKKQGKAPAGYYITLKYQELDDLYLATIIRHGQIIWGPKPGGDPAVLVSFAWEQLLKQADEDSQNQRRSEKAMRTIKETLEAHGL